MIRGDVIPIGHFPPYKRIDPSRSGHKAVITFIETMQNGGRGPDPAIYRWDVIREVYVLKDGI